jgi:cytochrome c-type biogenesis protein
VNESVGLGLAFSAGLLSFLSPCVLPLVPSYVTFVTGLSLEDAQHSRRAALVHALLFVLGFTLIFLAFGATATLLGRLLLAYRVWITRVGGALVLVFGLYLLGVLRIGALSRERRVHLSDKPIGYLGTILVGVAFGAGWSPCLGPILASILTYTATQAELTRGLLLLGAYSLGLAVPFVVAAVALERFLASMGRFRKHVRVVSVVAGGLMVVIGLLMLTDYFGALFGILQGLTPAGLQQNL